VILIIDADALTYMVSIKVLLHITSSTILLTIVQVYWLAIPAIFVVSLIWNIEYCSPVWSPSSKTLVEQLESV